MLDVTSGFGRAARYPICAPVLIAHLRFQSPHLHKPLCYPDAPCWKKNPSHTAAGAVGFAHGGFHRIMEWFALEETLKLISFHGRGTFRYSQVAPSPIQPGPGHFQGSRGSSGKSLWGFFLGGIKNKANTQTRDLSLHCSLQRFLSPLSKTGISVSSGGSLGPVFTGVGAASSCPLGKPDEPARQGWVAGPCEAAVGRSRVPELRAAGGSSALPFPAAAGDAAAQPGHSASPARCSRSTSAPRSHTLRLPRLLPNRNPDPWREGRGREAFLHRAVPDRARFPVAPADSGRGSEVSTQPSLLQAEQPQLSQPGSRGEVLQVPMTAVNTDFQRALALQE
ncbi:uncharacterized protein LOC111933705 isoform X2 [Cyanistes caeruleus]|uniref:uncharacterized protein LOC111933705 isoform X2 n=1 Tax=Cyanistes caeruleus TaxID=156563 RepID=UPI000CDA53A6|nr:uncharacterized protein LOC111933705 isoform X2 [Cyanistes caeruleus]